MRGQNICPSCIANYLILFHINARFYATLYSAQMSVSCFKEFSVSGMNYKSCHVIFARQGVTNGPSKSYYAVGCRIYMSTPIFGQEDIHCIRMSPKIHDDL